MVNLRIRPKILLLFDYCGFVVVFLKKGRKSANWRKKRRLKQESGWELKKGRKPDGLLVICRLVLPSPLLYQHFTFVSVFSSHHDFFAFMFWFQWPLLLILRLNLSFVAFLSTFFPPLNFNSRYTDIFSHVIQS